MFWWCPLSLFPFSIYLFPSLFLLAAKPAGLKPLCHIISHLIWQIQLNGYSHNDTMALIYFICVSCPQSMIRVLRLKVLTATGYIASDPPLYLGGSLFIRHGVSSFVSIPDRCRCPIRPRPFCLLCRLCRSSECITNYSFRRQFWGNFVNCFLWAPRLLRIW